MIDIYTYYPKDSTDNNTIIDNDLYLSEKIRADMLDDIGKAVMNDIDSAILLDSNNGCIETPFGITCIENMSTGCKTVLNYMYADESYEYINVNGCGENALELLFKIIDSGIYKNRKLILFNHNVGECSHRDYNIHYKDGSTEVITELELMGW